MTAAFIVTLDVGDDTDLLSIAEELSDSISANFLYPPTEVKPWAHPTLGITDPTVGGLLPPQQ